MEPGTTKRKRVRALSPPLPDDNSASGIPSEALCPPNQPSSRIPVSLIKLSPIEARVCQGRVVCVKDQPNNEEDSSNGWQVFYITKPNQTLREVATILNLNADFLASANSLILGSSVQIASQLSNYTQVILPVTPMDEDLWKLKNILSQRNVDVVTDVNTYVSEHSSSSHISSPPSSSEDSSMPLECPDDSNSSIGGSFPISGICETCLDSTCAGQDLILCDGCEASVCLKCAGDTQSMKSSTFFCNECSAALKEREMEHQPGKQQTKGRTNKRHKVGASSKFHGVSFYRKGNKWWSYIRLKGKIVHLGYFHSEIAAARNHDEHAIRHGKPLNFPRAARRCHHGKPLNHDDTHATCNLKHNSYSIDYVSSPDNDARSKKRDPPVVLSGRTRKQERANNQKKMSPNEAMTVANMLCSEDPNELTKLIPGIIPLAPFTARERRLVQIAFLDGLDAATKDPSLYYRYFARGGPVECKQQTNITANMCVTSNVKLAGSMQNQGPQVPLDIRRNLDHEESEAELDDGSFAVVSSLTEAEEDDAIANCFSSPLVGT